MNVNFSAEATWGNQPLEKLSELMAKRMKILRENAYDAAVATMINVLVSLRAQTRKAGPSTAKKAKPTLVLQTQYRISFDPKTMHRCLRRLPEGSPVEHLDHRVRFICGPRENWKWSKVWFVMPVHRADKPYYIAAHNEKDVLDFERRRVGHKVDRDGGLARLAFSIAANRISTRQTNTEKLSVFAAAAANRLTKVSDRMVGKTLHIEVRDSLDHAIPALKRGSASIDLAYKAAANKTYGILSKFIAEYGSAMFGDAANIGTTPFPEVVRRRRSA